MRRVTLVLALLSVAAATTGANGSKPRLCVGGVNTASYQAVCFTGCQVGAASQLWEIFRDGFRAEVETVLGFFGCSGWRRV